MGRGGQGGGALGCNRVTLACSALFNCRIKAFKSHRLVATASERRFARGTSPSLLASLVTGKGRKVTARARMVATPDLQTTRRTPPHSEALHSGLLK